MRVIVACVVAAVCVAASPAFVTNTNYGFEVPLTQKALALAASMYGQTLLPTDSLPESRRKLIAATLKWGESVLTDPSNAPAVGHYIRKHFDGVPSATQVADKVRTLIHATEADVITAADGLPTFGSDQYPYFGFIPPLQAQAIPDAKQAVSFSTPCWKTVSAAAVSNADGSATLTLTVADQLEPGCKDHFLLGTVESLRLGVEIGDAGAHTFDWKPTPTQTPAEAWDLKTKGIRIFRFTDGVIETIIQIVETALLFVGETTMGVPSAAAARNVYFMKEYAQVEMQERKTQDVDIDPSTIQSGDFFGIIRLDGLDPMLGWAMGSTTGHTVVALRDEITNELFITESTVKDSYWPTNGIQKTPWDTWVKQARNASFQAVHAPLSAEARAKFNVTKAWAWYNKTQGLDYGYHNLLFGWLDTIKDNYPCLPDTWTQCLEWSHVEVAFSVLEKVVPAVYSILFEQAFNFRLGTTGLKAADVYYTAAQQGIASDVLPTIVENDDWMYNTTRNGTPTRGPASVCCVHVCRTWKAAGLFDDFNSEVNCAEQTNFDDYSLTIFDPAPVRQQACVDADPDNTLCQISGKYTLVLNKYATRKPYAHMAEKCPSLAPNYTRPADC